VADRDWRVTGQALLLGHLEDITFCVRDHTSVPLADSLDAQTVADDLHTQLSTNYRACLNNGITLDRWIVRELGTETPTTAVHVVNAAGTLAAGTGQAPAACSVCVSLYSSVATKSGRGRFHIPGSGYASHFFDAYTWSAASTYWSAINTFASSLLSGWDVTHDSVSHHYSLRIWSRKHGTSYDVTSIIRQPTIRFLRTRMTAP
jgi:hypothetical protein